MESALLALSVIALKS